MSYSCKKEAIELSNEQKLDARDDDDTIPTETILGIVRTNPYTTEIMKQAWNNLYPAQQITSLPPTKLYVKFTPSSEEELALLAKSNEEFYDFPLENEMISLGDYYPQPGREIPELWAIVSPNYQFPISNYTVIAPLFIPDYHTDIVREAFRITGNSYDAGNDPVFVTGVSCCPECPNYPDCLITITMGCGAAINCNNGGDTGGGGSGGGGNPNLTTNTCDCIVFSDVRKPGGCVKVRDIEHNRLEGVRQVKIITKDSWFTEDETLTDDRGCWKIDERYSNKMWMWVKFAGPLCQIRGVKDGINYVLGWTHPMKDYRGRVRSGPPYNNIEVNYEIWQTRGSQRHMHWAASTVNNARHEFNEYATQEGIGLPHWLDIFIVSNRRDGFAVMANHCGLSYLTPLVHGLLPYIYATSVAPDLSIGANFQNSDQLKELSYHEMAHASHFRQVGCDYWEDNAWAVLNGIVFHNGNPYHQEDGIVDITEAWAFHVGWFFANLRYPVGTASINWTIRLEIVRNREEAHMPVGFFHDLKDLVPNGIEFTFDLCCGGNFPVEDRVQGFNCEQMFSILNDGTRSPNAFNQLFITNFSNNNPVLVQRLQELFDSY